MSGGPDRALRLAYVVASVAGVAFFVMSVALLGVWPARVLNEQTRTMSPDNPLGLSISEQRGREIYGREGCAYCHTQQIRYLSTDIRRFGSPTLAWETRADYPHLWGTRRIGPDLSRVGSTRSLDWHYTHLFAPRTVVPGSVMPAYAALFDGAPDRPRQSARDLVAYLDTLGRAREIAGVEGEAAARTRCDCPDDEMAQMAFASPLNASPARTRRGGAWPTLTPAQDPDRGQRLYLDNCAGCHGVGGEGDGPGASGLSPRPANLAEHEYTLARLSDALWNGVAGTAMQAWRDHPVDDLSEIADVVRGFHQVQQDPPLSQELVDLGRRVYADNCVQCHGEEGDGNGWAADQFDVAPTDLRQQRPSLAQALRALRNGIDGTDMAPWTDRLSEADLLAVGNHVRRFFQPDAATGGAGQ